jgi:hypothetical protein
MFWLWPCLPGGQQKAGLREMKFYAMAMVDQAAMALNVIEIKDVSCTNEEL